MAALEAERYLAHNGIGESPVVETAETVNMRTRRAGDAGHAAGGVPA
jgi:hypothetical protein